MDRQTEPAASGHVRENLPGAPQRGAGLSRLIEEVAGNPLLWLLAFVPVVIAAIVRPEAHTAHFILSVLAIIPLAAMLSLATESVAERTGDAAGGLINATLGNLTELLIALTALAAGQYALVKAAIAGAIVTNALFMLGAAFLIGGLTRHVQEFNRAGARLQASLLFIATVALLVPSIVVSADRATDPGALQTLSLMLAILLIVGYVLGLWFSLGTHKEAFAGARPGEAHGEPLPIGLALATLAGVTVLVAIVRAFRLPRIQALLLICLTVVTQALIFRWIEGWRLLDAFYFSIVSMATVGYGDLTPQTSLGKVAAIGFLVIGIGVFVLAVSSVAQAILRELLVAEDGEGRHAGRFRLGRDADEGPAADSDLGRRG